MASQHKLEIFLTRNLGIGYFKFFKDGTHLCPVSAFSFGNFSVARRRWNKAH
jgi:hypothetical protein